MARKPYRAVANIDPAALAEFRAGIRRRYSDEQILAALQASAARLGRSPTMKEFAADPEAGMHPQTVIEHFGTWNAAKRAAGLMPRRFATREELVDAAAAARRGARPHSERTGHPCARGTMPSASLYWHTFGSLSTALREAGFDVAVGEERLERAISQGARAGACARPPAEVRRLAGSAPPRRRAAHRVAGLPAVRRAARCVGDVPVPRPRPAARRGRRACSAGRLRSGASDRGDRREARHAEVALAGRPHGGQRIGLDVLEVGPEALSADDLAAGEREPRAGLRPRACAASSRQ